MGAVGVVVMDLGGAESLDEVPLFAERLLSDPSILPGPPWFRRRAARAIARLRAERARAKYEAIGGASPLPAMVAAQAGALQQALGESFVVRRAFRFSAPFVESVMEGFRDDGIDRVVVVPTFPQYSVTTAGTCLHGAREGAAKVGITMASTPSFPEGDGFIACLAEIARPALAEADWMLFTAHGLPQSLIRKGDPYQSEVEATARLLAQALGLGQENQGWSLAYQSRLGPARWLRPYVSEEIRRVLGQGVGRLCVVPLSFAAENLETRYDLDVEAADMARQLGCRQFRRAPAPGTRRLFIEELAQRTKRAAREKGWLPGGTDHDGDERVRP